MMIIPCLFFANYNRMLGNQVKGIWQVGECNVPLAGNYVYD